MIFRISSTISGLASVEMSPASVLFEIAASTRRMILPERVFGMSGTITIRRGRAMAPISRSTESSTRLRMASLGASPGFSAT